MLGAVSAATISLPMAIGYGITAFSALGNDFIPQAVVIGINAAILSCLFTAVFSSTPTVISGPSAALTIVIISVVSELQAAFAPFMQLQNYNAMILGFVALCVMAGASLQALLGIFRIGSLVKYVPYPVVSGFINGIVFSLILHQLPILLGIDISYTFFGLIRLLHLTDLATLLVGGFSFVCVIIARRYFPNFSPPLFGLLAGIVAHYIVHSALTSTVSGRVIGDIRIDLARTAIVGISWDTFDYKLAVSVLPEMLFFAIILCLISSIETLMSSAAIAYHSGDRCDSNKDLVGQGIGNLVAGIVCALPSAGSLVRSFANLNSGARTRWSGVICGLLILLIFITAHPYLSKIPLAVLSGVIVAVGISLFDRSEFAHFTTSLRSKMVTREVTLNLLISLTVTVLTAAVDLILAIVVGILITTANFVVKMGKSVIRRQYCCSQVRSKRVRTIEQTRLLQEHGSKIFVIELQGPLFFGSAEEVAKEIETSIQDAEYCIGNMKRISEIDATGARYLLQIYETLKKQGKTLLISHIWEETRLWNSLSYAGIIDEIGRNHFFQDLDSALEYAEDQILCGGLCEISDREFTLAEMDIFAGFSEEEMKIMAGQLSSEIYNGGDVIIRKNDLDRDLFLLIRGMVNVTLKLNNHQREIRLNTLSSGNTFGEIALLDNEPRSANVVAVGEVTLFRLTYDNFLDLQEKKPNVANKLILNMALNLSTRLRLSTEEINVLVEN